MITWHLCDGWNDVWEEVCCRTNCSRLLYFGP
nr:MAG TPA: hypothetical protein [Caudoviricetes sp.]